jgi:hypothetical protein
MNEIDPGLFENGEAKNGQDTVAGVELATINELTTEFAALYRKKKEIEAWLDEINAKLSSVEAAIVKVYENVGVKQMRTPEGLFTKDTQEYVSILEEKAAEAQQWLVNHGAGWMIKPSVHPQRLRSFVIKERDENGEVVPDCFKVNPVTKIKFTQKKGKK